MPGVSSADVFSGANDAQRKAIVTTEGPVLITAGPGTGKTFTLVQRCAYLIERCGVKAGEIMMATFTEKAAGEISQRLKRELRDRADLDDMYVGTFHAISLRILREHISKTRLKRGFTMLDDFDQKYLVWENLNSFKRIDGYSLVVKDVNDFNHIRSSWDHAEKICEYVNNLAEELVRPEDLQKDSDPAVRALGNICVRYRELLEEDGYIDFSGLQTECYRLLKSHPEILREMRGKIKYIMVDEYQDTNYIQEQLVFLFGGEACNICVVGDDDQGLYRFRGATIRNILEFPDKVRKMGHNATQVSLLTNYRSETGIIDFYNRWMKTTSGKGFFFDWGKYRFDKKIVPSPDKARNDRCVLRLTADNDPGGWAKKIASFIKGLKSSGFISDFNEVAFLSRSVRNNPMINLINALESEGITVNSPRSGMLFERDEIKLVIGCLIKIFPRYETSLVNDEFDLSASVREYYTHCAKYADTVASEPKNSELKSFLLSYAERHSQISVTEKYVYSSLIEMLYAMEPFKSMLDVDENEGSIIDVRKAKNLGLFMDEIKKFESLHGVKALNDYGVKESTKSLFNTYLRLLYNNGTNEYEFDSDSVPKGCVSFMTIHQSKGMEFPVVFVDSLGTNPSDSADEFMENVEKNYFPQPPFEPEQYIKYYDFWRVYYVAFSRAKKLLVLTCNKKESGRYKEPSDVFVGVYEGLSEPW
ncbi:MAG: ATP-dependent helicase [Clostridia bacterium]|nr:ATP-dependent helicase [Clostridia bacterium]